MASLGNRSPALGEMVAVELRRRGRSRRWLARQIGVSPQTINEVVCGRRPGLTTLRKLSNFLGEPLPVLLQIAGLAPATDFVMPDGVLPAAGDWPTFKTLRIMHGLPLPTKRRLLRVIEVWLEDRSIDVGTPRRGKMQGRYVDGTSATV